MWAAGSCSIFQTCTIFWIRHSFCWANRVLLGVVFWKHSEPLASAGTLTQFSSVSLPAPQLFESCEAVGNWDHHIIYDIHILNQPLCEPTMNEHDCTSHYEVEKNKAVESNCEFNFCCSWAAWVNVFCQWWSSLATRATHGDSATETPRPASHPHVRRSRSCPPVNTLHFSPEEFIF